jgi:hypothetical protein
MTKKKHEVPDFHIESGWACPFAGIYESECLCEQSLALAKDEQVPQCPVCRKQVPWKLLKLLKN